MQRDFTLQKRLIIAGLALLVAADLGLAAYSWRQASAPHTPRQQLAEEKNQLDLLRADIHRAQSIREKMPSTQSDCDKFERSLRTAGTGYSAITSEVYGVAGKAALRINDLTFKQKTIPNRNLDVVDMEATVTGEYASVVRFLNGLQRSENIYEIDGLSLTEDSQNHAANGPVRVTVHMKTYFRSA
jgi:Tfp pilus assembly protein PilO